MRGLRGALCAQVENMRAQVQSSALIREKAEGDVDRLQVRISRRATLPALFPPPSRPFSYLHPTVGPCPVARSTQWLYTHPPVCPPRPPRRAAPRRGSWGGGDADAPRRAGRDARGVTRGAGGVGGQERIKALEDDNHKLRMKLSGRTGQVASPPLPPCASPSLNQHPPLPPSGQVEDYVQTIETLQQDLADLQVRLLFRV